MQEIDEVRMQRDEAKAENVRLRREVARLTTLLFYAEEAIMGEYQARVELQTGDKS